MIDFTDCQIDLTANYGGSDKKRGILFQGKRYMLKLSDRIPEEKKNPLNSPYTNSAFSEHIGCQIIKSVGFHVQNTLLGNITMVSSKGYKRTYPVVACENFIPDGYTLVEFKIIESALLATKPSKLPGIEDIYDIINNTEGISEIRKTFYKTMLTHRYNQILKNPYEIYLKRQQTFEHQSYFGEPTDEMDLE